MTWRNTLQMRDAIKAREQHERQRGYADGYAGRPAASALASYQLGYRRGREQRDRDEA